MHDSRVEMVIGPLVQRAPESRISQTTRRMQDSSVGMVITPLFSGAPLGVLSHGHGFHSSNTVGQDINELRYIGHLGE